MSSVTGIFDSAADADRAVARLLADGFAQDLISLILPGAQTVRPTPSHVATDGSQLAEGGFTGAAIGSALGALLASLTAVGSLVLPGGNILMAGPIVAALSGAGAGGIVGGLSGVLIGAGFAMDDAQRYEQDLEEGKSIVVVTATDEIKQARARIALRTNGATTRVA